MLSRNPKIEAQVLELDATELDALDKAVLGNSITLTPGTLTLDVHENRLLVHALTANAAEGLLEGEMKRRVAALRKD